MRKGSFFEEFLLPKFDDLENDLRRWNEGTIITTDFDSKGRNDIGIHIN